MRQRAFFFSYSRLADSQDKHFPTSDLNTGFKLISTGFQKASFCTASSKRQIKQGDIAMNKLKIPAFLATGVLVSLLSANTFAQAVQNNSWALYLQYGAAEHGTDTQTAGVLLPWKHWSHELGSGLLTGHWDIWGSRWASDYQNRTRSSWVIGAKPTLRWRGAQGQSPWFIEAGVGVSYALNHRYLSDFREFSTRYNFASHIGVGYLFGPQQKNEISLRLEHQSNAGIKQPNPGENFLQLRYARYF